MLKFNKKLLGGLITAIVFFAAFLLWQNAQPKLGQNVFNKNPKEITINGVSITKKNNLWHVEKFDDYYANIETIKQLLSTFENAKYVKKIKPINDDLIPLIVDGKKYLFKDNIVKKGSSYWEISSNISTAVKDYQYLMNPFAHINFDMVKALEINGINRLYFNKETIDDITNVIIEDAKKTITEEEVKNVKLNLKAGIVINIIYYQNNWLKINFATQNIIDAKYQAYINNQRVLAEGWYFKVKAI